jgi:hypothetical protein
MQFIYAVLFHYHERMRERETEGDDEDVCMYYFAYEDESGMMKKWHKPSL